MAFTLRIVDRVFSAVRWITGILSSRTSAWRWTIPCIGIFLVISDWFYFAAVAEPGAMISVTALLRRLNVAVSFIIGVWLFHEHHVRAKAYALIAILAGAVLLLI